MSTPSKLLEEEGFQARFTKHWAGITERSMRLVGLSLAQRIALRPKKDREQILELAGHVDWLRMLYDWYVWGRPKQIEPAGAWDVWISCGGRGTGKTRDKSEWCKTGILTGQTKELGLVGPTFAHVRKVQIGGREKLCDGGNGSGLLDVMPPWVEYRYNETRGEIYFPKQNAIAYTVSAEKPEFVGRNPDRLWGDEPIIWRHPELLLDHLFLSNRKRSINGVRPQMGVSTTPRPLDFLRKLMLDPFTVTLRASTWENSANLARSWIERQRRSLAGTRLGQQELEADMIGDNPDALFALSTIERYRVTPDEMPELDRIGVGIDPAVSENRKSDKHGIVAVGRSGDSTTGHLYVLADRSLKGSPEAWGEAAWVLLEEVGASFFVVERNRIGDNGASNLAHVGVQRGYKRDQVRRSDGPNAKHALVNIDGRRIVIVDVLAQGDKAGRADPLSTIYETGRAHHVGRHAGRIEDRDELGRENKHLSGLEEEMTEWNPKTSVSPNALDALVHISAELINLSEAEPPEKAWSGFEEANKILRRAERSVGWLSAGGGRRTL
jgi:phage terminase large subunit-like protein